MIYLTCFSFARTIATVIHTMALNRTIKGGVMRLNEFGSGGISRKCSNFDGYSKVISKGFRKILIGQGNRIIIFSYVKRYSKRD